MNQMKVVSLAACTLALFVAGCASNQQFVRIPNQNVRVEDPNKGRIYVIRPSGMGASASFEVWDGKVHVGNSASKSYLCWERKPGEAIISGKEENVSTVSIYVKANQPYYIFQHMRMGWVAARNELEVVSEEQGKELLKKCKGPKEGKCNDHAECKAQPPSGADL